MLGLRRGLLRRTRRDEWAIWGWGWGWGYVYDLNESFGRVAAWRDFY